MQPCRLGRLRWMKIGGFRLENLTVFDCGTTKENVIGTALLNRFKVTLVLWEDQIWFSSSQRFKQPDLTGIQGFGVYYEHTNSIERRSNNLKVVSIDHDSRAMKAGLKVGDVIEQIDGKTFLEKTLFQINRSFEKPGEDLKLRIRRGEETRDITIAIPKEPPGMFALDGSAATNNKVK